MKHSRLNFFNDSNRKNLFSTVLVEIKDTSVTAPPQISVAATTNGKETDGSPVVFTFTRTGSTEAALSINYQLFGTAQAGIDYTGNTSGSISFAAGSDTATLSLPALADGALIDPYETIIARINASTNYEIATGKQFATATITAEGMVVIPKTKGYWYRNSGEFIKRAAFAALKRDGSVVSWGSGNSGGSANTPAGLTGVSQIFSTGYALAALKSDGSVISWGDASRGASAPAGLLGVKQIISTEVAFAALKSDGSVVSWGNTSSGGVAPAELKDVSQIFFTGSAFAALKSDGSVVCWGSKDSGGVAPAGLTGVSQIFSTSNAFAALKTDGSVISWGGKYVDGSKWVEFIVPAGLTGVVGFANPYTDDWLVIEATPSYTLTPSETSINEGATLATSVATTNVASGTTLYYSLFGPGITAADFSAGALTGSGTVGTDGKLSITHTFANDLTTEGSETLNIKLFSDSSRLTQVGTTASVSIADTSINPFNLDIDGDGKVTALGDGLMVIRKLFGAAFAGDALTNKAMSPTSTRTSAEIHQFIQQGITTGLLDVDKDGKTTALGNGLMVIRHLFGAAFAGAALTNKAISPDSPYFGTPANFAAVAANIDSMKVIPALST